jgi:uncharacterized protein YukE
MGDPLADPRAAELLAAVPDEVGAVAADFRTAAGESQATAAGLSAARQDGTWTGKAADAFRSAIGRLPLQLDRVGAGFSAVADALTAYETELSAIRAAFKRTVAELADAESRLAAARAVGRAETADSEIARLTRTASQLLDDFSSAREACRSAIAAAQGTAPGRPPAGHGITVIST